MLTYFAHSEHLGRPCSNPGAPGTCPPPASIVAISPPPPSPSNTLSSSMSTLASKIFGDISNRDEDINIANIKARLEELKNRYEEGKTSTSLTQHNVVDGDESLDAFASLANDSPDSIEDLDSLSIKIMSIHEE